MDRVFDLAIEGGLLFLVIFTPLAFSSVYPWGIALMEWMVLFMALVRVQDGDLVQAEARETSRKPGGTGRKYRFRRAGRP